VVYPIQPPGSNPKPRSWLRTVLIGRNPRMTLVRVAFWVVACFLIFKIVLVRVEVSGISMLPTYQDHAKNWINRLAYIRHEPRRGDIVAIRFSRAGSPAIHLEPPHIMLVKRIIGLPGETVAFSDGHVLINDVVLAEPYEKFPCDWNRPPVKLAPDEYFVVGDNRSMPESDHYFGVCKRYQIVGKILL
jgi:signal peptidase I